MRRANRDTERVELEPDEGRKPARPGLTKPRGDGTAQKSRVAEDRARAGNEHDVVLIEKQSDRHAGLSRRRQSRGEPAAARDEKLASFRNEAVTATASDALPEAGEEAKGEVPRPPSLEGRPEEERRERASEERAVPVGMQLLGERGAAEDRRRRNDREKAGPDHVARR
jgi:hypothetical protein